MLSKMSPVIAVAWCSATEFPVLMRQDSIAGKTTVGTKVEAKLVLGTLLNGTVIPKNAILSGEVIESVAKSPTEPSRLAVRMDSVQWKNGSAPVELYLTSWYYPAPAITPDIADGPTASHYDPTSPIYEPLPGSENSPRPVPKPTNRRVLMKNVEGLRRDDGGVVITSKIFNIKINKSTNYVLTASDLLPTTRSLVSPGAMLNFPPEIWPEGIFKPLCASLASFNAWILLSAASTRQFAGLPGTEEH